MNFSVLWYQSLAGRLVRAPLALIPKSAVLPVLQGPLKGKRWIAGAASHGCWLGSYEFEKQRIFAGLVKPGFVVYDLGANVGFYSLLASTLVGATGRVYAFEPVPGNLRYLRRHLELNRVSNCAVMEAAVSGREGWSAFDTRRHPAEGRLSGEKGDLRVQTVVLDALLQAGKLQPPNLIKCDIEGAELEALTGAREMLSRYHPTILLATHGLAICKRCCELLTGLGYQLQGLGGSPPCEAEEIIATWRSGWD